MNVITYSAFTSELEKIAWHSPAEIAGLGVLAVPGIKTLRDPKASKKEKSHAKWETAGLGALAVPAAHSMYTAAKKGGLAAIKHASVEDLIKRAAIFGGGSGMRAMATDAAHMAQRGMQGGGARNVVGQAAHGVAKMTHKLDPAMSMVPGGRFTGGFGAAAAPAKVAPKLTGMDKIRAAQQTPIK